MASQTPPGLACYGRTPEFTQNKCPEALRMLRGRSYGLDGEMPKSHMIAPGGVTATDPETPYRVELLNGESAFLIEFHRHGADRMRSIALIPPSVAGHPVHQRP
jgi:hypothetical protein